MKSRYALPVFFLAVAIFWFSLLLTTNLRRPLELKRPPELHEEIDIPYTQVEGVDSLELAHTAKNMHHHGLSMNIRYANQPHITLKVKNVEKPEAAIKQVFVRQGRRLILQPESHHSNDENADDNENTGKEPWRIEEIILPLQIKHLHTNGIELDISENIANEQNDAINLTLPELHIESEDTSVKLNNIHVISLNIRNRYNKKSCTAEREHSYHGIVIYRKAKIESLFIESIYGYIDLQNSAPIQSIHLKTTPETGMELDRLDIYQRMRWEPLPTPPLPACKDGAERMMAPPSIKAQ